MKQLKFYAAIVTMSLGVSTFSPVLIKAEEVSGKVTSERTSDSVTDEKTVSTETIAARKADLALLLKTLESKHPNMYTKNDKSVFEKKLTEIQGELNIMSDFDFSIAVSELTALIGDSHTKASIGSVLGEQAHFLPISVTPVKEGLLITAVPEAYKQVLGGILTSINGMSMDEVKQKIMPMLSYDNDVYLERQFAGTFYVYEVLAHYGVLSSAENISLGITLGGQVENIQVNAVDSKAMKEMTVSRLECPIPETAKDKSKIYFSKPLDEQTLYIQYNSCFEDENLPMETFAAEVEEAIAQKGYKRVILDLRYNGGGSDGVIIPLMYVLEEKYQQDGVQLYTLIGSNTFSSALINSVMLKQAGAVMVGTPTGGSVDHFGSVSDFELPNSKINIQYSNKFIDLASVLEAAKPYGIESFSPDILAEQTREDYLLGKDTALEAILADTENKTVPQSKLTRAALAVKLGRDYTTRTGNELESLENNFEDVTRLSYFMPYVAWANTNHIMIGKNETTFAPNQTLTHGELAVVLMRYAKLLGISLNNLPKTSTEILDSSAVPSWEKDAVNTLGGTAVLPLDEGMFKPEEVVSCEAFENIFKEFITLINLK